MAGVLLVASLLLSGMDSKDSTLLLLLLCAAVCSSTGWWCSLGLLLLLLLLGLPAPSTRDAPVCVASTPCTPRSKAWAPCPPPPAAAAGAVSDGVCPVCLLLLVLCLSLLAAACPPSGPPCEGLWGGAAQVLRLLALASRSCSSCCSICCCQGISSRKPACTRAGLYITTACVCFCSHDRTCRRRQGQMDAGRHTLPESLLAC